MEKMNSDLKGIFMKRRDVMPMVNQLIEGLVYMHSWGVKHRDIKLQNILVELKKQPAFGEAGPSRLVFTDFGLARGTGRVCERPLTHEICTLWYRPPEVLLGCKMYDARVDWWSLGCVVYEMLYNKALFPGESEIDQLFKIFRVMGTPTEKTWPGITNYSEYNNNSFPKFEKTLSLPDIEPQLQEFIQECLIMNVSQDSLPEERKNYVHFAVKYLDRMDFSPQKENKNPEPQVITKVNPTLKKTSYQSRKSIKLISDYLNKIDECNCVEEKIKIVNELFMYVTSEEGKQFCIRNKKFMVTIRQKYIEMKDDLELTEEATKFLTC